MSMWSEPQFPTWEQELAGIMRRGAIAPPVFSERPCCHCGGPTVEGRPLPLHARKGAGLQGAPRRRFWCDPCEKVTS